MKKVILIVWVVSALAACNSNNDGTNNEDPNKVHPVSETLPDCTKLVNDSVIMPDTVPNNGKPGAKDDSSRKQPQ